MTSPAAALELLGDDDEVVAAVGDARLAVDRLLAHRLLRRRSAEVSAESSLRGAVATAQVADPGVPALAEVRDQLTRGVGVGEIGILSGALRLYAGLGPLVPVWSRAPRQVLARMHVMLARGAVPPDALGVIRPSSGVDAASLSHRLTSLSDLVVSPGRVPAVVLAAVVHGELAALEPFPGPVGTSALLGRACERLVLVARGLDPKALTVPEVGHRDQVDAYRAALLGYRTGRPDAVRAWVVHCAGAVAAGATEALAVCEALQRSG